MSKLQITQIRSAIKRKDEQKRVLVSLGITRMGRTVTHEDTPQIRGMIKKIEHLLKVSEAAE